MTFELGSWLSGHAFQFMLVFTRLGAALMMFPGIGESYVSPRIRLLLALSITFLVYPLLMPLMPAQPQQIPDLFMLLAIEALVGVFFGTILRLMSAVLETAGGIIGLQTGLSNAMILNPAMAQQSALPSAFLGVAGVTLIFVTGLDHFLLQAMVQTYAVFPVGGNLPPGDLVETYARLMTESFMLGVQLAAPFLIIGLVLMVALAFVQRLMAQVQLFLIVIPVQILGGLILMALTMGLMLAQWLQYYDQTIASLGR